MFNLTFFSGFSIVLGLLCSCSIIYAAKSINSHLSSVDDQRLQQVFADGLKSNDIQSIYYGALNYKAITPAEKQEACKRIVQIHKDSKLNVRNSNVCQ